MNPQPGGFMSTLLDNSSRPLWVWVLVIVLGSLFILGSLTWLIRWWVIRRRARSDIDLFSDEPAEKKLTLRRGRIVPATSYLSLTGSRFGVASYGAEDGRQTPSVRSKSPFEWWSNLKGRSSRLSYVSHVSSAQYPSRAGSFYQRPEMSTSKLSLTSKDGSLYATVAEIKVVKPQSTLLVPSSFKRSPRHIEPVNFSRSFSAQNQRSLAHQNQTLSRIEESTPRQSVFSTASFKNRLSSYHAGEHRASGNSLMKIPTPLTHSRNPSRNSSGDLVSQHLKPDLPLDPAFVATSSPVVSLTPTTPSFPEPIADPSTLSQSRQSLWESSMKQFPWLEHHQHQSTLHEQEIQNTAVSQSSFPLHQEPCVPQYDPYHSRHPITHVNHPSLDQRQEQVYDGKQGHEASQSPYLVSSSMSPDQLRYQVPQIPTGPLRTRSKKGNVLRKKSLERGRVLSTYAS